MKWRVRALLGLVVVLAGFSGAQTASAYVGEYISAVPDSGVTITWDDNSECTLYTGLSSTTSTDAELETVSDCTGASSAVSVSSTNTLGYYLDSRSSRYFDPTQPSCGDTWCVHYWSHSLPALTLKRRSADTIWYITNNHWVGFGITPPQCGWQSGISGTMICHTQTVEGDNISPIPPSPPPSPDN